VQNFEQIRPLGASWQGVKYKKNFLFKYTFFNDWPTGQIDRWIFMRNGSNDAVTCKGVPFRGTKFKLNI